MSFSFRFSWSLRLWFVFFSLAVYLSCLFLSSSHLQLVVVASTAPNSLSASCPGWALLSRSALAVCWRQVAHGRRPQGCAGKFAFLLGGVSLLHALVCSSCLLVLRFLHHCVCSLCSGVDMYLLMFSQSWLAFKAACPLGVLHFCDAAFFLAVRVWLLKHA